MMNWNLEGLNVRGMYLDTFEVRGKVNLSRVKYGGEVSHHVTLDTPINVYGTMRDVVILDHKNVAQVYS
jgi:hypothetical protein